MGQKLNGEKKGIVCLDMGSWGVFAKFSEQVIASALGGKKLPLSFVFATTFNN